MNLTVVIVNFYKARRAVESIRSLRRQSVKSNLRFVVVDNSASSREAELLRAEMAKGGDLIVSKTNIGYTRAVNLAARTGGSFDYIVLVSPDIIVDDTDAFRKMISLMEIDRSIGVLATVQRNDDGTLVEVARRYPTPVIQVMRRTSFWPK